MAEYGPKIAEIYALRERLGDQVFRTPVLQCPAIEEKTGGKTTVFAKLEFLQRTGTFKARGALATLHGLSAEERMRGVTAVSAGNHAIAVAFAAATVGTTAKVVMTRSANPFRVAACAAYGAEVVLADDVHLAFALAEEIRDKEGRYFIHPFEGPSIALGTGTMGVEICEQIPEFDAIVIPVGGGGLIGGIANAVRQMRPDAEIIGVEPVGADSMHRSFASGTPQGIEKVATIADSLGAPFALPYSFELTRQNVDRLVTVDDDQLRKCMGFLFRSMKIAVEPACVATTAALLGPLRESMRGRRAVLV
ncbi:MAG: pyridoxal-phosphate dependent enzyme, partial [Gammaproteobacteria bacterium]|nr:pyridoxal-phosphate dependent enzyme [Gammaproteobacteria bacterium]